MQSEAVIRGRTDNKMATSKRTLKQTKLYDNNFKIPNWYSEAEIRR